MPQVTVLMTLYNKGPWVEEAVASVLAQSYTDFELLVVDDASTDGSLEKVKAFSDPRIRILGSAVNTGRAAAANRGYDAARGTYVAVLDADDRMHPERLMKQVAYLEAHPEVGALGTWSVHIGREDQVLTKPTDDAGCRATILFDIPVSYPSAMFRRGILEEHGLRCDASWKTPGMDYLFVVDVGRHTAYGNLPEPLLQYREGANNMRVGHDRLESRKALEQAIFQRCGVEATAREQELHLAFNNVWPRIPGAKDVRELWQWKQRLLGQNREKGLFPEAAFEAELGSRWQRLFHYYADRSFGAGLAHWRLVPFERGPRLLYLIKATVRRWVRGAT